MNANIFKQRLDDLMESALNSDEGAPLGMMICRLEIEKAKCVSIQLQVEAINKSKELAGKILPANGKLPPIKFPPHN